MKSYILSWNDGPGSLTIERATGRQPPCPHFLNDSWDSPDEDYFYPGATPGDDEMLPLDGNEGDERSGPALDKRWQAKHRIPAPLWADVGYAGIRA